ncbi:TetR family transcriptional regulator [Streptomyces griseoviridis]|jgi:AcrR family transcriptional regulator|uniref:TetR family transcriptional regulator n=3 Tax=Streptomyces TaxID=1883 RepID=A0A918LA33_STRGD|nr:MULTISPECIES: TetR/AcrR family transcriptional regulator [Streptomyces]MDP9683569.1 AcrR family transcriptional regulator [Streptomyces griseoviridis]GGS23894.1 TetR family transcriptional regulator [Streptomyces niveoruber]GGS93960.1 TetR family transcriptional regulator [Streptomyces griseoviridis]GGU21393.1 TetR family transcriptional regulator [Streptomyces daghestanicus]GHI31488.1 TetR family transcriptional regulator [Streptomyces daghestanicus]
MAATRTRRTERRENPLSRERIVEAAIELLDAAGEGGLTFRALAERLATGPGAIYWHVTGKDELLHAATDAVVAAAVPPAPAGTAPRDAVRAVALGVFDAIDAHPWVGAQLARSAMDAPILRIFERLGRQVQALGVPRAVRFTAASALLNYVVGVAGQNAANARAVEAGTDRTEFLTRMAAAWTELDPEEYPFVREVAGDLPHHDDRVEFLAGIDLILTGIAPRERPADPPSA